MTTEFLQSLTPEQLWGVRKQEGLKFNIEKDFVYIWRHNEKGEPEHIDVWSRGVYNRVSGGVPEWKMIILTVCAIFACITLGVIIGMSINGAGLSEQLPAVVMFAISFGGAILTGVTLEK